MKGLHQEWQQASSYPESLPSLLLRLLFVLMHKEEHYGHSIAALRKFTHTHTDN
jgi:hypothetical protein